MTRRLVPRGALPAPRRRGRQSPVRDASQRYIEADLPHYSHVTGGYNRLEQENVDLQALLEETTDALEGALVGGSDRPRSRSNSSRSRRESGASRRESWGSAVADISSEEDRAEEARTPQQKQRPSVAEPQPQPQPQPQPEPEPEPEREPEPELELSLAPEWERAPGPEQELDGLATTIAGLPERDAEPDSPAPPNERDRPVDLSSSTDGSDNDLQLVRTSTTRTTHKLKTHQHYSTVRAAPARKAVEK